MKTGSDISSNNRQKIMHVLLSMAMGGAETLVYNMVRHRTFLENRPVVCCLQALGELGEKLKEEGFTVYSHSRRKGIDWSLIGWIREIIETEKIDVVHAHQYPAFFYAVPAAFLAGRKKFIYTEHGRNYPDTRSLKRYIFNPFLVPGADHVVSISSSTAKAMADMDHFPLRKIKIIHNGIDFSLMNPDIDRASKLLELGIDPKCRIIGTAARLEPIKNIPMMFNVFKLVHERFPDTCLMVAGKGSQEESLKKLAQELGLGECIKFIGLRFDMPEIYQLMDVFLLTSFTEGISVTLLEAMASGVPVAVTDVGGNPEVVSDRIDGFLVPVDNDAEMAERVIELLSDPALSNRIGSNAQEKAVEKFSFDTMIAAYRNLYDN